MPLTVVHLIGSLDVGGAETLLLDLVRGMRGSGYRHDVVSMLRGGVLLEAFRKEGVPVHALNMARRWPDPRGLGRLRGLLRATRPDIVQTWMYHANLLGVVATVGVRPGPRLVWCLHAAALDVRRYSTLTRLTVAVGAKLSGRPAAIVANSEATRDYHAGLGYRPREWTVIYNGVDVRRFAPDPAARAEVRAELGLPPDARLVGLFARWDPMKDHATFLGAAARVAAADAQTHFVLAGQGITAANAALRRLLEAHGPVLAGRVHLLGVRRDMPRLNAALDAAAVTSVSGESFCLAAAEAMASGVPCVVTDLTFLPALVGDTGVVVPRGDPDRVAASLRSLLDREESQRRELGARARERIIAHFSLEAMIGRYRELYDRLSPAVRATAVGLVARGAAG